MTHCLKTYDIRKYCQTNCQRILASLDTAYSTVLSQLVASIMSKEHYAMHTWITLAEAVAEARCHLGGLTPGFLTPTPLQVVQMT